MYLNTIAWKYYPSLTAQHETHKFTSDYRRHVMVTAPTTCICKCSANRIIFNGNGLWEKNSEALDIQNKIITCIIYSTLEDIK